MYNYIVFYSFVRNIVNKVFNRNKINLSDGVYEIEDRDKINQYSSIVWMIMQNSYSKLGGFKSYKTKEEMANIISLLTICVLRNKIVAAAIYRDDLGGQKLNGCGTIDGRRESKDMLRKAIQSDIENLQKWHWVEVSYPLEKWFKELNGNPIPSQMAARLLHKSKSKITCLEDGVHYQRQLGVGEGNIVTKAIYGFKDKNTYDIVMKRLEEYTGFDSYDDFKNNINSSPRITEDIDYLSNNQNEKVSEAIEIIIQFGNLYEDGCYEVSPKMYEYLKYALDVLQNTEDKNQQILSCIRSGRQYLKSFLVLQMHTYNEADYLLAPLE